MRRCDASGGGRSGGRLRQRAVDAAQRVSGRPAAPHPQHTHTHPHTQTNQQYNKRGTLTTVALTISAMSVLTSVTASFGTGLFYGGPAVCVWGWLAVSAATLAMGLGMAELASAYPTSGGMYYWQYKLAGRRFGPWVRALRGERGGGVHQRAGGWGWAPLCHALRRPFSPFYSLPLLKNMHIHYTTLHTPTVLLGHRVAQPARPDRRDQRRRGARGRPDHDDGAHGDGARRRHARGDRQVSAASCARGRGGQGICKRAVEVGCCALSSVVCVRQAPPASAPKRPNGQHQRQHHQSTLKPKVRLLWHLCRRHRRDRRAQLIGRQVARDDHAGRRGVQHRRRRAAVPRAAARRAQAPERALRVHVV